VKPDFIVLSVTFVGSATKNMRAISARRKSGLDFLRVKKIRDDIKKRNKRRVPLCSFTWVVSGILILRGG